MNLEEHCSHSLTRYGVEGRDVHQWMDEPVKIYGFQHRKLRHLIDKPPQFAIDKYGLILAQNIILDHLIADKLQPLKEKLPFKEFDQTKMIMIFKKGRTYYELRLFTDHSKMKNPYLVKSLKHDEGKFTYWRTLFNGAKARKNNPYWINIINKLTSDEENESACTHRKGYMLC